MDSFEYLETFKIDIPEADLGLLQHPGWNGFVIIVNSFQLLIFVTKHSISDVAAVLDPPLYFFSDTLDY